MPNTQSELASDPFSGEDGDIAGVYDEIQEEDGADECLIGLMRIHSDGQLEILAADPARASFLEQVMHRLNGKPAISVESEEPSPPPFELAPTTILRGDPRFPEALLAYVRDYYGLRIG
ncbi:hypothetical protein [Peristeroidobacter soli]|uniref:hypothetical protein n=1 Tax=Peristeroidobacter soli TaxID=2497877 RepID=UPI00101C5B34|nr:hypothetical protein [Peristeroidobacter soli]